MGRAPRVAGRSSLVGLVLPLGVLSLPAWVSPPPPPPQATPSQHMAFEEYEPKPTLVVPEHPVARAKYPFIDVHNHQDIDMSAQDAATLVREMDGINLQIMV